MTLGRTATLPPGAARRSSETRDNAAKTSGATGLQIYVPVEEKHSYAETRSLAERIGAAIVKADPARSTMEWDVAKRRPTGRGGRSALPRTQQRSHFKCSRSCSTQSMESR